MTTPTLTYAQAARRRDGLFATLETLCWQAKGSADWAQATIGQGAAVTMPDGTAINADDRAALLADYTILSNLYDLLHNRNPAQGNAPVGLDIMLAVQARIVPGVNAE